MAVFGDPLAALSRGAPAVAVAVFYLSPFHFLQGILKYTTLEDKKIACIWLFLCTGSFSVMA